MRSLSLSDIPIQGGCCFLFQGARGFNGITNIAIDVECNFSGSSLNDCHRHDGAQSSRSVEEDLRGGCRCPTQMAFT